MTDEALLILVSKDYVVKQHGFLVLCWDEKTWWDAVEAILRTFTDETLANARIAYPNA